MNEHRFFDQDHWPLLAWLLVTGISAFGLAVCWNEGLLALLPLRTVVTSASIGLLLSRRPRALRASCAAAVARIDRVRRLQRALGDTRDGVTPDGVGSTIMPSRPGILGEYLLVLARRGVRTRQRRRQTSTVVATLIARAKAQRSRLVPIGVLLKLGLLGTIVGFI